MTNGSTKEHPLWVVNAEAISEADKKAMRKILDENIPLYLIAGPWGLAGLATIYKFEHGFTQAERDTIIVSIEKQGVDFPDTTFVSANIRKAILDMLAVG